MRPAIKLFEQQLHVPKVSEVNSLLSDEQENKVFCVSGNKGNIETDGVSLSETKAN